MCMLIDYVQLQHVYHNVNPDRLNASQCLDGDVMADPLIPLQYLYDYASITLLLTNL